MKKNKKLLLRTIIIALVIGVIYGIANKSYGSLIGVGGVIGIGMVFVYAVQVLVVALGVLGQGLIQGLTASGADTHISGLKSIFFNHNPLTTAAYFTNSGNLGLPNDGIWNSDNVMYMISQKITQYYYVMRNLAIAILLFVLLYIAIRMALSTVSSDEAKYKKMLTNWAVSLALVFVLHYIMIVTFYVSNTLVSILESASSDGVVWEYTDLLSTALIPFAGFGEAIIFMMLVGMSLTFILMYIKRIIVLGFLILIAPLITITYSIDKIGDGKSQALNTWLKEFIYNVIIQPFHCILYITLINTVIEAMAGKQGIGGFIIYIIVLQFVKEAENIIKKIFSIQADSMPGLQNMGTLALGVMSAFGSAAKGAGAVRSGKKMPKMNEDSSSKVRKVGEQGAAAAQSAAGATGNSSGTTGTPVTTRQQGTDNNSNNPAQTQTPPSATTDNATTGTGSTQSGQSSGQSAGQSAAQGDTGNATPINAGNRATLRNNSSDNMLKKIIGKPSDFKDAWTGTAKFFGGPEVTTKDAVRAATRTAGTIAAAGLGLGMGDTKSAIGLGMTAYGLSDRITGAIDSHKNNLQLEKNEEVYDEQYEEYVEAYRARYREVYNRDISEEQVRDDLVDMFEDFDNSTLNLNKRIKDDRLRELTNGFLKGSYSDLRKSYSITGGEKPTDLAKSRTMNKSSDKYKAKHPQV